MPILEARGIVRRALGEPSLEMVLEACRSAVTDCFDATVEAFRRLTATFIGALTFKLPPSADEMRDLQKRAVATAEQHANLANCRRVTRCSAVCRTG